MANNLPSQGRTQMVTVLLITFGVCVALAILQAVDVLVD